ncbi:hypothetical protein I5P86_21810 [Pseudomonas glycinae]|uniref:hypothetical protein n=1 Tax=Pseudomonas glycinae TaxID=1785145 RepID=UPI0018D731EC|nr:hypothetical protein [Pseudomonas glycinae]MBH3407699.1 hypothetical protein [Pseudomonas glycinae]
MTTENEHVMRVVKVNVTLTGDWEIDKSVIQKAAMQPTRADKYYDHAVAIHGLFDLLTYGTPSAPSHPQRKGLLLKVHGELYPIAHFAKLHFTDPTNVIITWIDGSQKHDAIIEYTNKSSNQSDIEYLEVTTLQNEEDAKELKELSEENTGVNIKNNSEYDIHRRKLGLLEKALTKKGSNTYPANTALLVYTDEHRFRKFYYGMSAPEIDRKGGYEAVLEELAPLLKGFSHVFIYSKDEIYCTLNNVK